MLRRHKIDVGPSRTPPTQPPRVKHVILLINVELHQLMMLLTAPHLRSVQQCVDPEVDR